MKIKYLRLTKEERKKVRELYYATPKGKALKSKLRLVLFSSLGLLLCFIYLITDALMHSGSTWDYAYAICILVFAIFFLVAYFKLRLKRLNDYVVNNKLKL